MWYNNKTIKNVASYSGTKNTWAIINGITGMTSWIRISTSSADGGTNILSILTSAFVNGKAVNVQITNNMITGVYMA